MATLKDIKLRINSINNTQQITRAMKLVSAAKMRKAEENILHARPYSEKLRAMVSNLSKGVDSSSHPLLKQREGGKAVVLLITTDKGLCGGLNTNLCKNVDNFIPDQSSNFDLVEIVAFGKKGTEFFQTRNREVALSFRDLREQEMMNALKGKVKELIGQYMNKEFNHLYLAFNRFKNVITQIATIKKVLPIEPPADEGETEESTEYTFEPTAHDILNVLLPQYVESQAYTGLLDNIASEYAARMTAMDAATRNAAEMLEKLQLQYNRARQAAITSELIEIISGAEAV